MNTAYKGIESLTQALTLQACLGLMKQRHMSWPVELLWSIE